MVPKLTSISIESVVISTSTAIHSTSPMDISHMLKSVSLWMDMLHNTHVFIPSATPSTAITYPLTDDTSESEIISHSNALGTSIKGNVAA